MGLAACLGCAGAGGLEPRTAAIEGAAGEQSLYRLTFDSGEGRTSLKVVLRREPGGRFQLVFSDVAGRRVWSLDHTSNRAILIDHRAGTHCSSNADVRLADVHPEELPLAAIPRILAGLPPVEPPATRRASTSGGQEGGTEGGREGGTENSTEFADSQGRRWRVSSGRDGDNPGTWALLDESGPTLWWAGDGEGGILSRRGGQQYRWKLVVREPSVAGLGDLVPADSVEVSCDG